MTYCSVKIMILNQNYEIKSKNSIVSHNYDKKIESHNYEESRNYEILSQNYELESKNDEILSKLWNTNYDS